MAIETKVCFHRYGIPSGENGSAIAPGKVADLVAAGQIKDIKPLMTVVGGRSPTVEEIRQPRDRVQWVHSVHVD